MKFLSLTGLNYFYGKMASSFLKRTENAVSATKLQTSRKINNVNFDGTSDIKINPKYAFFVNDSAAFADAPWHKIASTTVTNLSNRERHITFYVTSALKSQGILKARATIGSDKLVQYVAIEWLVATSYIDTENFVIVAKNNTDNPNNPSCTIEIWAKCSSRYTGMIFRVIDEAQRNDAINNAWELYTSTSGEASYTEGDLTATSTLAVIQNNTQHAETADTATFASSGTNIENYISDSDWSKLGNGTGFVAYSDLKIRKIGKLVEIKGTYVPDAAHTGCQLCTIPDTYKPNSPVTSVNIKTDNQGRSDNVIYTATVRILNNTVDLFVYCITEVRFVAGEEYPIHIMYFVD